MLPTIPLLFIYQPKTIDNAIALPGDVLPLIDVSNALPDFAALASDASVAVPVKLPSNVVAVATPVTAAPLGSATELVSSLLTISST